MSLYEKLPTPRSIRVLRLAKRPATTSVCGEILTTTEREPGKERLNPALHPVCCEMRVISVAAGDTEPFDALSYVWGDPSVREGRMIGNGRLVNITSNLWSALHQVWTKWSDKVIWVDAICINQEDIPERNQQVAMLGSIYRTADYVVVWLGELTEGIRSLFRVFESLKSDQPTMAKPPVKDTVEPNQDDPEKVPEKVPEKQPTSIGPLLEELFSRPWFSRVWTLQEIKLAQRAILCCGPLSSDFSCLTRAIDEHNASEPMAHVCGLGYIANPIIEVEENVTLYNLLVRTRDRKATDPRDKVYSVLSLLPKHLYDFLEPDYSLSEEDTIVWASRIFTAIDRDTACLADTGLENRRHDDTLLPSWAVDWRGRDEYAHEGRRGFPDVLRRDTGLLKARTESCRNVDRVSRQIHLLGWGFGRLQIHDTGSEGTHPTVFLAAFPDCALKLVGADVRDAGSCYGHSPESWVRLCKKIKQHDEEQCPCMEDASRVVYPFENLPRKVRDGDWLWRHAFDVGNHGHDFVLHPVNDETCSDVSFQIVGEAWGYGIHGLTPATRFSVSLRHPESTVVLSSFILI
ncbi:putative heterokaryon incompatibility protein [Rhypophila decipiens]|uniref:Heterokaryon incompatibility protein n=1 Tax=Rhypophila decipiens TaxID=261697 RepID=A0AAN7B9A1_9PEZI|nr:putative heterokaryon incompatibility protein [Rhypophila decipiens]